MLLKTMHECYVYELIVDGIVRYIGMGRGTRVHVHSAIAARLNRQIARGKDVTGQRVHLLLAEATRNGSTIEHHFIRTGLTRDAARSIEIECIASAPSDQLWNVHPGGGGASPERMAELWSDPEWKERQRDKLKAAWNDPEYRATMCELRADPLIRERISNAVRTRFADPEERKKQSIRTKATYVVRPDLAEHHASLIREKWAENHERYSKSVAAHWSDPKQRQRQSEAAKRQWSDPIGRENLMRSAQENWTPELRKWRSEKTREQFNDPVQRHRMSEAAKARNADTEYRKRMGQAIREGKARKRLEKLQAESCD